MKNYFTWIANYRIIGLLFFLLATVASMQSYLLPDIKFEKGVREYTRYNNYVIFRQSFHHLAEQKDLYTIYPEEQWDLYKYSPSFAALFGVFALLPDVIGLFFWNTLNALVFLIAIYYLPKVTLQQKGLIMLACIFEMMTAIQNEQSNGLIAGLIILAFGLGERKKFFLAAFCIVLTVYIKIFGIVGFALFLFYPQKLKMTVYSLFWAVVLFLIPLIFVDMHQLVNLYHSWFHLLSVDHPPSLYGYSVFGWINAWFHLYPKALWVLISGAIVFLIPFSRFNMYPSFDFRLLALSSVLIWIVIFNHMAESPTFIIAMAGVAIWFFSRKMTMFNIILFSLAILLTSLSSTDLFSHAFRNHYIKPYVLKAFPCIMIWFKIIFDMMISKKENETDISLQSSALISG